MLNELTNTTAGLWTIGGVTAGVVALICVVVVSRTRTRLAPRVVRTEETARAAQANRDRLSGRR